MWAGFFLPLRVNSLPLATIYEVKIPLRKWKNPFCKGIPLRWHGTMCPGASFQNRSYWDRSALFWIPEDTLPSSWWQLSSWADEQAIDQLLPCPLNFGFCTVCLDPFYGQTSGPRHPKLEAESRLPKKLDKKILIWSKISIPAQTFISLNRITR
jgi:hypothetical protein